MTLRPLVVAAFLSIPAWPPATPASDVVAPAAGVLASMRPPVAVERAGSNAAPHVELGMRLEAGDVVKAGPGGGAIVYLAGGAIVHVKEGERLAVPARGAAARAGARDGALPAGVVKASESGLWILNDPEGSIVVAGMRGGSDAAWGVTPDLRVVPLSPRYEVTLTARPRFVAAGGPRPARISVATGKQVVWTSGGLDGDGPWSPDGFPALDPSKLYAWRLESAADGAPVSEWVAFRVSPPAAADDAATFERRMADLSGAPGGATAADVLRCGRYLETSSWTPLLSAAIRVLSIQPDSTLAKRARDRAIAGFRLEAADAALLAGRLD